MSAFFGSEGSFPLQFVVIFFVILAILTVAMLALRRFSGRGLSLASRAGQRSRQPRLGIVDIYELDRQRQLILLRRDNVEHLLLVGGLNDVVIETNIQRGIRMPAEPAAPDPEVEAYPEPQAASEIAASRSEPLFEPSFPMPVVVPADGRGGRAGPSADAVRADGQPVASAELESEEIDPIPEVLKRDTAAARILRRTTPTLVNPRPDIASERGRPAGSGAGSTEPTAAAAPFLPPVIAPSEPRPVDAAVLSDMARRLDSAIARSPSAVTPAPKPSAPPVAVPPPDAAASDPQPPRKPGPDAVAAGMAATAAPRESRPLPQAPAMPAASPAAPEAAVRVPPPADEASKPSTGALSAAKPDAPKDEPENNASAGPAPPDEDKSRDPDRFGLAPAAKTTEPKLTEPKLTEPRPFSLGSYVPKPSSEPPRTTSPLPAKPDTAKPESGKPDTAKPDPETGNSLKADLARLEPAKPLGADVLLPGSLPGPALPRATAPAAPRLRQEGPAAVPGRSTGANNPFSVEEIEAEFARLLGRPLDKK